MPLRRVVLLEGPSEREEFRAATSELREALGRKGIGVVSEDGDGMVATAGYFTNLAELFAGHLGGNDLPCGLLNTANYYTDLLGSAEDSLIDRLVRESQRGRLIVHHSAEALIQSMMEYLPPETRRRGGATE